MTTINHDSYKGMLNMAISIYTNYYTIDNIIDNYNSIIENEEIEETKQTKKQEVLLWINQVKFQLLCRMIKHLIKSINRLLELYKLESMTWKSKELAREILEAFVITWNKTLNNKKSPSLYYLTKFIDSTEKQEDFAQMREKILLLYSSLDICKMLLVDKEESYSFESRIFVPMKGV